MFDTPHGRIAVLICYDIEFPELARNVCELGNDILFGPSCTDDREGFWLVRYCMSMSNTRLSSRVQLTRAGRPCAQSAVSMWSIAGPHEQRLIGLQITQSDYLEADTGDRQVALRTCTRLFRRQCQQSDSGEVK